MMGRPAAALALLAVAALGAQCQPSAPPPPPPAAATPGSVRIGDREIRVTPLAAYEERRNPIESYGNFASGEGLFIAYARPRFISLHFERGPVTRTFRVAFLDGDGRIRDLQTLLKGPKGITSKVETPYALVAEASTLSGATEGGSATLSEDLRALRPEPLPLVKIGGAEIRVELSVTAAQRERGLMGRTKMSEGDGMLFAYPSEADRSYWMANCYTPLSIAFIRRDGTIATIHHDMKTYPDPENVRRDDPRYPSRVPVQYALEVNQGFFLRHGIMEGARVELPSDLARIRPE